MHYITTFLVGVVSFLSPCMLPMLPIYFSYFSKDSRQTSKTFLGALCFVAGFSVVFCSLGLFAGSLGALLVGFHEWVERICGIVVALLGLNFLGVIKLPSVKWIHLSHNVTGFLSAFVFGVVFSISHIPCVGAFLGTALVTAGVSGSVGQGLLLLFCYSMGMGVPFLMSALLTERLTPFLESVKKNDQLIHLVCGILLVLLGIGMATGLFHHLFHMV